MREQEQQQKKEQEQKGDLDKPREEKEGIQNTTASRFTAPPQFRPKRNKYHWVVKVSSQKPEGSEVQKGHREIKVSAQKQELKIKEDLRRVEAWKKPRAEEELAGGTVQQVSRNGNDEKFRGRVNQMAGMCQRMEKLSMKPEKVGGSASTDVSGHRWNPAFSRSFSRQKATGAGLVWVRKGDSSGGSGSQS